MSVQSSIPEQQAAAAFDKQSAVFDSIYSSDKIIQYKRERVRRHISEFMQPHSAILELNAGTGEDAIYFAKQGHVVHATDISSGMLKQLSEKVRQNDLSGNISMENCSFNNLEHLINRGPYDLIFSNFAGLNCTGELGKVIRSFNKLLKPGGHATLVLLPEFCLWETLLVFKGKFKTAFRRFFSSKGRRAHIEGEYFRCWYYNPAYVKKNAKGLEVFKTEGLCTIVPPSYIQHFAEKHPRSFQFLKKTENRLKAKWPWRSIGDYYIITLQKKIGS